MSFDINHYTTSAFRVIWIDKQEPLFYITLLSKYLLAQSAGAAEYTDCTSAEG